MSQCVPPKLVRIRSICKPSYEAGSESVDWWSLLPLRSPPFAGKLPLLAESWVRTSGGASILALRQAIRPAGGRHDNPAHVLSEPEAHIGGSHLRIGAASAVRQSG